MKGFSAVHPRGHGEHTEWHRITMYKRGSSPWARGTLFMLEQFKSKLRFIPVGTGNTFTERAIEQVIPVHPRGHGEHYTKLICAAIGYGSSPWARGTRKL